MRFMPSADTQIGVKEGVADLVTGVVVAALPAWPEPRGVRRRIDVDDLLGTCTVSDAFSR